MAEAAQSTARPSAATIWKSLDWQRELTYFCVALGQIFWLAAFLISFETQTDFLLPTTPGAALLLMAAHLLPAVVLRRIMILRLVENARQLRNMFIGIGVGIIISLLLLPVLAGQQNTPGLDTSPTGLSSALIIVLLVIWLWRSGYSIGFSYISPEYTGGQMRTGVAVLFFTAVLTPTSEQFTVGTLTVAFFFIMLLATALSRSTVLRYGETIQRRRFSFNWLAFVATVAFSISLTAVFIALLLTEINRDTVIYTLWLIVLIPALLIVFQRTAVWFTQAALIALFIAPIAACILVALVTLMSIQNSDTEIRNAQDVERIIDLSGQQEFINTIFDGIISGALLICGGVVIIAVLFYLYILIVRDKPNFNWNPFSDVETEKTSGDGPLANIFRRLGDVIPLIRQFGIGRDLFGALSIRWAYARMEEIARKHGTTRRRAQTPSEFYNVLIQRHPDWQNDVKIITDAYIIVRYGEIPENEGSLEMVRGALRNLREITAHAD